VCTELEAAKLTYVININSVPDLVITGSFCVLPESVNILLYCDSVMGVKRNDSNIKRAHQLALTASSCAITTIAFMKCRRFVVHCSSSCLHGRLSPVRITDWDIVSPPGCGPNRHATARAVLPILTARWCNGHAAEEVGK
jgi:hypothetical protein